MALFLLRCARNHQRVRAEDVDVDGRGRALRARRPCNLMHHDRRFGHTQASAAVFLRHRNAQPATIGHSLVEIVRKFARFVAIEPIGVIEGFAHLRHRIADRFLLFGKPEIHGLLPSSFPALYLLATHANNTNGAPAATRITAPT